MRDNARSRHRWNALLPTVFFVALAVGLQSIGAGDVLDRRLHDTYIRVANSEFPELVSEIPDVAVVTIDPRSLRAQDAWPWSRKIHAEMVERLTESGANSIAFDIDFSSTTTEEADERFASAIRKSGRVILATFSQVQTLEGGSQLEIVNRPIPILESAAASLGSVLVPIDSDGVVRNAPRETSISGEPVRSLARAAMRVASSDSWRERIDRVHQANEDTLVDFRRAFPKIPTLAYVDVLDGRFDPADIAGRSVFIGATAAEFQDLWATPVQPALPGVLIQAIAYRTAAAEATGAILLSSAPLPWTLATYLLLGLLTLPIQRANGFPRIALFTAASFALVAGSWSLVWHAGVLFPVTLGLALLAAQYVLGIESFQRTIRARVEAQDSSLTALARIGDAGQDGHQADGLEGAPQDGLSLALGLLGDVVHARGVVLLRAEADGRLNHERLEWRPDPNDEDSLWVDLDIASSALQDRKVVEHANPSVPNAPIVYSPLIAGQDCVGVLVVLCRPDQKVDSIKRRTIATVGAQLALTAQNLRLIDRLRETFESSIAAVAGAVEARDGYTDQHCRRLAAFSSLMGTRMGMAPEAIRAMELGALLHDVGKIGIPDSVLNKPGRLSTEERTIMQQHPEIGAGIVAPVIGLEQTTLDCIIHHHERWDGAGYPEQLEAEEIPMAARIVSIVDVWDALSTQRPYKKAFSQAEVHDLLLKGRGTQFDPDLVDLFFEILHEQGEEMLELVARSSTSGVQP